MYDLLCKYFLSLFSTLVSDLYIFLTLIYTAAVIPVNPKRQLKALQTNKSVYRSHVTDEENGGTVNRNESYLSKKLVLSVTF